MPAAYKKLAMLVCLGGLILAARAEITCDGASRTITLRGATNAAAVFTPADVWRASESGGWQVVSYQAGADTYVVKANLAVGADDGSSTVLQLGSAEHPRETLVLAGALNVQSPRCEKFKYYGANCVQIGIMTNAAVQAALRFDCSKAGEFGLTLQPGATLRLCHGELAAVAPDSDRKASWRGSGRDSVIVSSRIAGFTGLVGLGFGTGLARLEKTVFEYNTRALDNGQQYARECVFRHCDVAVADSGSLYATLVGCRFEQNRLNWTLVATDRGIQAIDCFFGPPAETNLVIRSALNPQTRQRQYPVFMAQRHLVFEVKNAAGQPVPNAVVVLTCEQNDPVRMMQAQAVTGPDGLTPDEARAAALQVTDFILRATDKPDQPAVSAFTYQAVITAPGYAAAELKGLDPDQSWRVKTVTLAK